ncbi:hypothetical protein BDN72DRAFT_862306 [Pluteus cervinus]|uniref:Uncharacterized protein n=1 Tax=Pluteus cervinus TaxID=181527 RepID=A0ACD3ABY9_9AGAR|nr:hypothetical protein BDN72DRAFT_862306 [Pluteus cervinus]
MNISVDATYNISRTWEKWSIQTTEIMEYDSHYDGRRTLCGLEYPGLYFLRSQAFRTGSRPKLNRLSKDLKLREVKPVGRSPRKPLSTCAESASGTCGETEETVVTGDGWQRMDKVWMLASGCHEGYTVRVVLCAKDNGLLGVAEKYISLTKIIITFCMGGTNTKSRTRISSCS